MSAGFGFNALEYQCVEAFVELGLSRVKALDGSRGPPEIARNIFGRFERVAAWIIDRPATEFTSLACDALGSPEPFLRA
jgi:hypothetical protein